MFEKCIAPRATILNKYGTSEYGKKKMTEVVHLELNICCQYKNEKHKRLHATLRVCLQTVDKSPVESSLTLK